MRVNNHILIRDTEDFDFNGSLVRYRLHAVVDHFGSVESGHYTCTVRDGCKAWRRADDSVVLMTGSPCEKTSKDAYMFTYLRC